MKSIVRKLYYPFYKGKNPTVFTNLFNHYQFIKTFINLSVTYDKGGLSQEKIMLIKNKAK